MKKIFVVFAVLFAFCAPVVAMSKSTELAKIQSQLKKTETESKAVDRKVKESERNVEKTKKNLVTTAQKVDKLEIERSSLSKSVSDLQAQQEKLNNSVIINKGRMYDSVSGMLVISSNPSFDTDNMHEFVLTNALLTGMAGEFNDKMESERQKIEKLEKIASEKRQQQEKLGITLKKYSTEKKDLDKLLKTRTAQNEKLRGQQYELQKRLRDLSARAKNISELAAGLSRGEVSPDTSFSRRKLHSPVSGKLVSVFGEKSALGLISDGWRIRVRADALVMAPADGRVDFADSFKGYGRVIIMSHKNSYHTVLTGLDSIDVLVGQEVLAGEPVGRMPNKANEMYMELRHGSRAIDPARLFTEP